MSESAPGDSTGKLLVRCVSHAADRLVSDVEREQAMWSFRRGTPRSAVPSGPKAFITLALAVFGIVGGPSVGIAGASQAGRVVRSTQAWISAKQTMTTPTPPGKPAKPSATAANEKASVSWPKDTVTNGAPITSYTVTSSTGHRTCSPITLSSPSCTVTELSDGHTYTFTVKAHNENGTSQASTPSNPVTPSAPEKPAEPDAPRARAGRGEATVSWTAPTTRGARITRYVVTSTTGRHSCTWAKGSLTCKVTGLVSGHTYRFSVVAHNAVGTSAASAYSTRVTTLSSQQSVWAWHQTSSLPGGGTVRSVSCTTPGDCIAVGLETKSSATVPYTPYVVRWNGSRWTVIPGPPPEAGWGGYWLDTVVCTSASSCAATGSYAPAGSTGFSSDGFLAWWDGKSWSTTTQDDAWTARDVACVGTAGCVALGYDQYPSLFSSNGAGWTRVSSGPSLPHPDDLSELSCTTVTSCVAVGTQSALGNPAGQPLVELWTSGHWTQMKVPASAKGGGLDAVSCQQPTMCMAVGINTSTLSDSFAERWDGHNWSLITDMAQAPRAQLQLSDVSCASATLCVAVGAQVTLSAGYDHKAGVALIWAGGRWQSVTTSDELVSELSCPTTNYCLVVGGSHEWVLSAAPR